MRVDSAGGGGRGFGGGESVTSGRPPVGAGQSGLRELNLARPDVEPRPVRLSVDDQVEVRRVVWSGGCGSRPLPGPVRVMAVGLRRGFSSSLMIWSCRRRGRRRGVWGPVVIGLGGWGTVAGRDVGRIGRLMFGWGADEAPRLSRAGAERGLWVHRADGWFEARGDVSVRLDGERGVVVEVGRVRGRCLTGREAEFCGVVGWDRSFPQPGR